MIFVSGCGSAKVLLECEVPLVDIYDREGVRLEKYYGVCRSVLNDVLKCYHAQLDEEGVPP